MTLGNVKFTVTPKMGDGECLLPCEDETVENMVDCRFISYHRIFKNAMVTSVVIGIGKAALKICSNLR